MRVALAGKGGAGKTTLAATLARSVGRTGRPVVAVDADSNPNLAVALGLPPSDTMPTLPASAISRRLTGPALTEPAAALLERHGRQAPDGVRLIALGAPSHAGEGCLCSAHGAVSALLGDLAADEATLTVVDLEASPEHLSRGTARHVDLLLLVVEPYYRSLEAARLMAALAAELPIPRVAVVANKVRSTADRDAIDAFAERHGLSVVGCVPFDTVVLDADAAATPLIDRADAGDVVRAIGSLLGLVAAGR